MSKCKITGKVLAVQLGRYKTQIVLLGADSQVLHSTVVTTPAGAVDDGMIQDAEAVRSMLKSALSEPEFKRVHQVVFSLCTSQVITETIATPDLNGARLEKLLQANVDMYFPVDMHEYHLVWQVIGPRQKEGSLKELAVQLWAVPREMLSRYYYVANKCGLSVAAIDYCGHSIATAVGAVFTLPGKTGAKKAKKLDLNKEISFGRKKKEAVPERAEPAEQAYHYAPDTDLYLSLERDLLGMTFVQGGQVVHQRFIRSGENPSYQFGEIAMMVEYFRSLETGRGSRVQAVVCGTMAGSQQIREDLEDVLGLPLTVLDTPYEPRLAICVGAARTDMDFGIPDMNAPSKARRQVSSQLWQYGLILAAGLVLVSVVMLTLSSRLIWNSQVSSLKATQQTLTIQAQKYAGFADNYKAYSAKYDSYSSDWETIFDSLRTYNNNLVLMLQELEDVLPENSSVVALNINPDALEVQFACETKEEAAYLIMALRELKYAVPAQISSLQGGGGGAATDYGNGEEEEPPTEGSNNDLDADRMEIVDLIVETTVEDEVWDVVMRLTDVQAADIEKKYGAKPDNVYKSIDSLVAAPAPEAQRREAVEAMLTENFYAIYHFTELIQEDMSREQDILFSLIVDDLLLEENEDMMDAFASGSIQDGKTAREYNARLVPILLKTSERLAATEKLFATNDAMAQWYIYHLEVALKLQKAQPIAYLDMNKVINDLMKGGWKTDYKGLNEKLDALLDVEVWVKVQNLAKTDISQYTDAEINWMLKLYMDNGDSGNEKLNAMLDQYGKTLDSGSARLNALINDFDESKAVDPNKQTTTTPTTPTPTTPTTPGTSTGSDGSGTTGSNSNYSAMLNKLTDAQLGMLIGNYLANGTTGTGVQAADDVVKQYLQSGTTGDTVADARIYAYLKTLIEKYNETGNSGISGVNGLIEKYKSTGNSGFPAVNTMLAKHLKLDVDTTTGTGGGGGAQDTRIFFNAILAYKSDLIDAELARKGLSAEEKVEKLEVEQ